MTLPKYLTCWFILTLSAARTVVKAPKSCHITSILCFLHWLRTTERIEYKFLSLTYKVFTIIQPPYLHNLISVQRPRSTRSSSVVTFVWPPSPSFLKIADRSFRYAMESTHLPHFGFISDSPIPSFITFSSSDPPICSSITHCLFVCLPTLDLKIACRISCRLTYICETFRSNHIRQMEHIVDADAKRLVSVGEAERRRAHAGLCHVSSTVYSIVLMLCDFLLCSDEYDIFKTCVVLVWLKNCTSTIQQYDSRPKTERDRYLKKRYWEGNFAAKPASRR